MTYPMKRAGAVIVHALPEVPRAAESAYLAGRVRVDPRAKKRRAARERSQMTFERVGHLRWLSEVARLSIREIVGLSGLDYATVSRICEYETWCEVEPRFWPGGPQPDTRT